ncbi:MAG: NAD-dependent epimerase/dehydratase family protein [Sphingobacteriaceae bacterium]
MIVVTGATGFLGSVLTRQLLQAGHCVRGLKRCNSIIPAFLENQPKLTWLEGDICDPFLVEELLAGATQVYHTAAVVSFNPEAKKHMLHTNIAGTANVVNACLEHENIRLVHVSSVAALGEVKPGTSTTEEAYLEPNAQTSGYSLSKHLSEFEVWRGIAEGLDAVIVNPSIILGKECGLQGSGALFSIVKKGLSHYPSGSCGVVAVDDVATCMIKLMDSKISGERYIINAENWLYKDLFAEIAKQLGLKGPQKEVKTWQLLALAKLAEWTTKISKNPLQLSADTARSAGKLSNYSNEKIKQAIAFRFSPIAQEIADICRNLS